MKLPESTSIHLSEAIGCFDKTVDVDGPGAACNILTIEGSMEIGLGRTFQVFAPDTEN